VGRQNMAMIERALTLFTPFYRPPESSADRSAADEITALRAEVETLKQQLADRKSPPLGGGGRGEGMRGKKPEPLTAPEQMPQTDEPKLGS